MSALTVYHYPGCSTCKKALRWLSTHDVAHEAIDIKAAPPSAAVLKTIQSRSGQPLKKLFNTAGQSYRNGGFKDRLGQMSDEQAYAALAADGMLIKRPLVLGDDVALIGFREADWAAALG